MEFNSNRLSIARKRRSLTKKKLAESIGVAPHTISRWENGDTETPEIDSVQALARLLEFPEEFFFGADLDVPYQASFRSLTSMTAALRDAALTAGSIGFLLSDWVDDHFNLPDVQVPDLRDFEPGYAARVLREEWSLGELPISNMIHLLESKGVRVFSLAENTKKVNAFSLWRNQIPFMFLNTYKSAESSRFDAAHELGHLVLHQDGETRGRIAEDQANWFASAFLMPRSDVIAKLSAVRDVTQMKHAKRRWKVSVAALNHRLHKLGLTSEWKYRDFCIELSKRGYNRNEPDPINRERSKVWDKVLQLLWAERKSISHVASELSLPESELSGLVFGMVTNDIERPTGPPNLVEVGR